MASLVSRLVACLVAVVAVLQLVHLVLLSQLEERRLEELHHLHTQSVAQTHTVADQPQPARRLDSINNGLRLQLMSRGPHGRGPATIKWDPNTGKPAPPPRVEDVEGEFRIFFDVGSASVLDKVQQSSDYDDPSRDVIEDLDVTLVSHSHVLHMKQFLFPLIERWSGPLSVALWVRSSHELKDGLGFIAQARRCHILTQRFATFHIVFPLNDEVLRNSTNKLNRLDSLVDPDNTWKESECQTFLEESTRTSTEVTSGDSDSETSVNANYPPGSPPTPYPVNLLRNVGRRALRTRFSLVSELDLLPSVDLRKKFQRFVKGSAERFLKGSGDERKTVFVLPAFEKKGTGGKLPGTKTQLLALIEKYQARPYYFDLCWKCQVHTDYEAWQREASRPELSVLFEVLWKDPWEPFFISDNSIPPFDERFRQYGFNRLSQLCELHMGGFKFAVLNDAFLIHKGYETPNVFEAGRTRDLEVNRAHFRHFKNEMRNKYPHSTRRCY